MYRVFKTMLRLATALCRVLRMKRANGNGNTENGNLEWAKLVLPWLSPSDLASVSSTCKSLGQIAKTITTFRVADASRSFEKHTIPFFNTIDTQPYSYFMYSPISVMGFDFQSSLVQPWGKPVSDSHSPAIIRQKFGSGTVDISSGCVCKSCSDEKYGNLRCPCSNLKLGFLDLGLDMEVMSECGSRCVCGVDCENRSTQRGVGVRLKIVKDSRKGWGLHADQFVRRGEFICEYAGELLTTEEARKRQQVYDKLASSSQFSSALLVVREHLPSGKACLRVNIDATRVGNVARFINHSCDGGNLSTVLVRNSGTLLPRLCFFAARNIMGGEELAFSYGDVRLRPDSLPCFCASSSCLGILPSEKT